MILDMDGVLYKNTTVETRIVQRLEEETRRLGLGDAACQSLYLQYGSTIRGLICEGHLKEDHAIDRFYHDVYDAVDVSVLRSDALLQKQLEKLRKEGVNFHLATNSPEHFVERVLEALDVKEHFESVVCPSKSNGWLNKPDPRYFEQLPTPGDFFDDSLQHCEAWNQCRRVTKAYHVTREMDVMTLVADALEVLPATWRLQKAAYLQAKEVADLKSLNQDVLRRLQQELASFQQGEELRVLDLGCGFLSMLPVLLTHIPEGMAVHYLGVDRDAQLLAAAEQRLKEAHLLAAKRSQRLEVKLQCDDAVEAVRNTKPQTLVMGCSILDLIDVDALANALRQSQAGALLYFPIHYAGTTSFQGPFAASAEPLSINYNESLETRGQVKDVTALYNTLGEELITGASDWNLAGEDLLLKQLISFMATNALGFQGLAALRDAVTTLRCPENPEQLHPEVQLHVTNVDYLGRVPSSMAGQGKVGGSGRIAVEFTRPSVVSLVKEEMPTLQSGQVLVKSSLSGISAGTERRMLMHGSEGEPLDSTLPELSKGTAWPFRYGYCLVGSILSTRSPSLSNGQRVFCFHPHASHAVVSEESLQKIPEDIADEDALFFANMETALALCQDAAPVLGDHIGIFGAGTVGALTAALLAPRFEVTVFDPNQQRQAALLRHTGANLHLGDVSSDGGFDVAVEVSGAAEGLAMAIQKTRRGGTVVMGSLYGENTSLPLGLQFHRSELTLLASQVSYVRAPLSTRWSKVRRAELTWKMLRQIRPKDWLDLRKISINEAPEVYATLVNSNSTGPPPTQWIFTYYE